MNPNKCIICGSSECKRGYIEMKEGIITKWEYECKYCGKFEIDDWLNISNEDKFKIQCYVREQNDEFNKIPYLTEEKIKQIIKLPDKTLQEQFDLFMKSAFENNYDNDIEILRIKSWVKDFNVLYKIAKKAEERGFIKGAFAANKKFFSITEITFDGLEYIEYLRQPNQNSKKIFLAFKFDDELNKIFNETISDMIRNLGLNPMIVNQDTTSHDEKISDKIISELKSSRILIADLTHHSQNVYYEIGYAMGMGIPIILTCKKDFMQNVAFDINQYPVFEWEDENELKEKIENRIKVLS